MRLDRDLIKDILTGIPTGEVIANADHHIEDSRVSDYIDSWARTIGRLAPEELRNTIDQKQDFEVRYARSSPLASVSILFFNFTSAIYNLIVEEYVTDGTLDECLATLMRRMLLDFRALVTLLVSGTFASAAGPCRSLYETYVIFRFIDRHPDLARSFLDHSIVRRARLVRLLGANDSHSVGVELETSANEIEQKYDKRFGDNFGWTMNVIKNPKERTLKHMAEMTGLDDYASLYFVSSEFLHASSLSVVHSESESATESGFIEPIVTAAVELLTNGTVYFSRRFLSQKKEHIYLMNIVYAVREDVVGA